MLKKFRNLKHQKMKSSKFEEFPLIVQMLSAGTAACLADTVTFPLDTTKVRLQIQGERDLSKGQGNVSQRYRGVFGTMIKIAKEEGPLSLYNGLSAGLQRQMCFASIRIGLYDTFKVFYHDLISGDQNPKGVRDIIGKICAGITTGSLAVVVAQPTEVVKIRLQAQITEARYKSTTEAYKTIYKDEGVRGLWKGCYPNITRTSIVNISEIVCYDIVKGFILRRKYMNDNMICHFTAGVVAGFFTTVASSPVDVIKTRYMNSPKGRYRNAVHCTVETITQEGIMALYKGFMPSFTRLVAWNIVLWVSYEKIKVMAISFYGRN